ncbi:hypothetical protein AYO40_05405 [Planctomycetaceae bacterium SCGC AG-212-D15]|nr:hypothetical protein AYO40_05405 [Planctomycetaceae bacterium SCGC AG-212-D15]
MRNLLALLAAALLAFAGIGWYLGWYQVKSEPSLSGHQNVNIDINGSKIIADVEKGKKVVQEMKKSATDAAATAGPSSNQLPAPNVVAPQP